MDASSLARAGGSAHFLRARDWVLIGSVYSMDSRQGSLD